MNARAAPANAPESEAEVSRKIRDMFGLVAPRYDLLNRLLSLRIDRYWRRCLVEAAAEPLRRGAARILDLCCGTGDVLIALESERRRLGLTAATPAVGSDFCRPMLSGAKDKLGRAGFHSKLIEADALQTPLPSDSLDLITIAYGLRNLTDYRRGLEEMLRLLKPGGCLVVLEFSRPRNRLWRTLFEFYFRRVLPCIGNAVSGSGDAYTYLEKSVRNFPSAEELTETMRRCGFARAEATPLTGGVSVLYLAYK